MKRNVYKKFLYLLFILIIISVLIYYVNSYNKENFLASRCPLYTTTDCSSGNYELVGTSCLKKCSLIMPGSTVAISDPKYCKFTGSNGKPATMRRDILYNQKAMNGCKPDTYYTGQSPAIYDEVNNMYIISPYSKNFHTTQSNNYADKDKYCNIERKGKFIIRAGMTYSTPGDNATCYSCQGKISPVLKSNIYKCEYR